MKIRFYFLFLLLFFQCEKNTPNSAKEAKNLYFPNHLKKENLATMKAYVIGIKDGDSFVVLDSLQRQREVRMWFIDCPEHYQPYTFVAKKFTSEAIFHDSVWLYYNQIDAYGRILALVENSNHEIVNEALLRHGLAWHYRQFSKDEIYQKWEDSARSHRIGIFEREDAQPPWEWRRH